VVFEPVLVSDQAGRVACLGGGELFAGASYQSIGPVDLVLVGSIHTPPTDIVESFSPALLNWLLGCHASGAGIASVCAGSVVLAAAGLLDGKPATTHWSFVGLFRGAFPRVELRAEQVLVEASEDPLLITAGGGSSWHDLTLELIRRFAGMEVAAQTARVFMMRWHEDQQTAFACLVPSTAPTDSAIAKAQNALRTGFAATDALDRAWQLSGLTARTYQRRFLAATGMSPRQYLQLVRVEKSKTLLESGDLPVTEVGAAVGYEDGAFFRRLFRRLTGMAPGEYRRRFLRPLL
jgi:transcriptional regulator GlxA family with amidase domain